MNKDIRLYSLTPTTGTVGIRLVVASGGNQAWSIEIDTKEERLKKKMQRIDERKIKPLAISKFQDELITSNWNALQNRYELGSVNEKDFLRLLASLWAGFKISETGILPLLDDQQLLATSLLSACTDLTIKVPFADQKQLNVWLASGGVWRRAGGCWFD